MDDKGFVATNKRMDEVIQVLTDLKDRVWELEISISNRINELVQHFSDMKNEIAYYKGYTKTLGVKYEELHSELRDIHTMIKSLN